LPCNRASTSCCVWPSSYAQPKRHRWLHLTTSVSSTASPTSPNHMHHTLSHAFFLLHTHFVTHLLQPHLRTLSFAAPTSTPTPYLASQLLYSLKCSALGLLRDVSRLDSLQLGTMHCFIYNPLPTINSALRYQGEMPPLATWPSSRQFISFVAACEPLRHEPSFFTEPLSPHMLP